VLPDYSFGEKKSVARLIAAISGRIGEQTTRFRALLMSDFRQARLEDLRRFLFISERLQAGKRASLRLLARSSGGRYSFDGLLRTMSRLEEVYRQPLLIAGPDGGLQLTTEGVRVSAMAREIINTLDESLPSRELRISVDEGIFNELFPTVLARFLAKWAGHVKLIFHKIQYARLRRVLQKSQWQSGSPSLGIGWNLLPDSEQSWSFRLRPAIRSVLVTAAERCGFEHRQEIQEIAPALHSGQPLLLISQDQRLDNLSLLLDGVKDSRIIDCPSHDGLLKLVRRGVGAAVLPFWPSLFNRLMERRPGRIRYALLPPEVSQHITVYLPPRGEPTPEVAELITSLRETLIEMYPESAPPELEPPPRPTTERPSSDTTLRKPPVAQQSDNPDTCVDGH
jgi:DNA-binding transcriptional LysR family regulator